MILDENHFIYQVSNQVYEISKVFNEDTGFYFLNHVKIFDDGTGVSFNSLTSIDWAKHFFEQYFNSESFTIRLKTGINYWERESSSNISIIGQDARNNFNIDARIEYIYRDEINQCFNMYSFHANRKNADKAYSFYNIHRSKLLRFIGYFNCKAKDIIFEGCKAENRIIIPDYVPSNINNKKRDYMAELQYKNAASNLTDREFEIMIIYSAGFTAKQVAEMLHRSSNTIENHIDKIHKKTKCKDKTSLRKYVIDNGWSDLEKFFFSYLPDKPH